MMSSVLVPPNIVLLWKKSAWNCHETMREILSLLAKALKSVMKERSVILILDVHSSHIDTTIFAHARRLGVRLVYIPASLTFLLQPCDTHVFAALKQLLRKMWQDRMSQNASRVDVKEWLSMIFRGVRSFHRGPCPADAGRPLHLLQNGAYCQACRTSWPTNCGAGSSRFSPW
jgi:hypothetical protein